MYSNGISCLQSHVRNHRQVHVNIFSRFRIIPKRNRRLFERSDWGFARNPRRQHYSFTRIALNRDSMILHSLPNT